MRRYFRIIFVILFTLLTILIIGGLVWGNIIFTRQNPGGLDFLIPWSSARTFLEYGISPYDEAASQRTQILYYGKLAETGQDPLRYAQAFPALLFYFPFALIKDFTIARAAWMILVEIALSVAAFLLLRITRWRIPFLFAFLFVLFGLLWFHGLLPLIEGNGIIYSLLFIVAGMYTLQEGNDEFAGMLLALTIFSPRTTGIFLVFILLWVILHRRWRVLAGSGIALGILLLVSYLLLPGWLTSFVRTAFAEQKFMFTTSTFRLLKDWSPGIGNQLAWLITIIVIVLLFLEWRASRECDFPQLLWTSALSLALTPFLGLPVKLLDFIVLFLPITVVFTVLAGRWSPHRWARSILLMIVVFMIHWGALMGILLSGSRGSVLQYLAIATPVFCVIGLYWIRWWAIRPPRIWIDQVKGIP